ncbi:MAG: hypothetical protein ACOVT5_17710 [Armatimonadaceae bacterium]
MSICPYMAGRLTNIGNLVIHWIETTPEDKRDWLPPVPGSAMTRTVYDMLAELIQVNELVLAGLNGTPAPEGHPMQAVRQFTTGDEGIARFRSSLDQLVQRWLAYDDNELGRTIAFGSRTFAAADLLEIPYRNLCYHGGQINLIQLLAGDAEMHRPKS